MGRRPLLIIFLTGLLVFGTSAFGSYYWASLSEQPQITPEKTSSTNPSTPQGAANDRPSASDTQPGFPPWNSKDYQNVQYERVLAVQSKYTEVNYRKGPSLDFKPIKTLQGNQLLLPLDRRSSWFRARSDSGTIGWIHRSTVRILTAPQPWIETFRQRMPPLKQSTKKMIPGSFRDTNRLEVDQPVVNIRRGPGTQFSILRTAYRFEEVRLMGRQGEWYNVKTVEGQGGWIKHNLVRPLLVEQPETGTTLTLDQVEIRYGPSYKYRPVPLTGQSSQVTLLYKTGEWYQVEVDNSTIGWIHQSQIKQ